MLFNCLKNNLLNLRNLSLGQNNKRKSHENWFRQKLFTVLCELFIGKK